MRAGIPTEPCDINTLPVSSRDGQTACGRIIADRSGRTAGLSMRVVIGIPSGRAQLTMQAASTLFRLQGLLAERGHRPQLELIANAEIFMARNVMATRFLDSGADLFIGMDDDMVLSDALLGTLIDTDHEMLGVYAPQRQISLEAFHAAAASGLDFRAARDKVAPLIGPPTDRTGIFEVPYVGCGFYLLRRSALQRLIDGGMTQQTGLTLRAPLPYYGFFNNIRKPDGEILGEDFSFCHRLRQAGVRIFAYRGPGVGHTGDMTFWS